MALSPRHRDIAETCLELLNIELVKTFSSLPRMRPELGSRRVEAIGFQVGQQLAERLTRDRARFTDHLDVIKFICKDFWSEVFKRQVDNLKTNHRGVYVLHDSKFRWLAHISADPPLVPPNPSATQPQAISAAVVTASRFLHLPCGLIRGALTSLGVHCTVSADVTSLPACEFGCMARLTWRLFYHTYEDVASLKFPPGFCSSDDSCMADFLPNWLRCSVPYAKAGMQWEEEGERRVEGRMLMGRCC